MMNADNEYLGVWDTAKELDLTPQRIRQLADEGVLAAIRTRSGRRFFIRTDVAQFAEERRRRRVHPDVLINEDVERAAACIQPAEKRLEYKKAGLEFLGKECPENLLAVEVAARRKPAKMGEIVAAGLRARQKWAADYQGWLLPLPDGTPALLVRDLSAVVKFADEKIDGEGNGFRKIITVAHWRAIESIAESEAAAK